MVTINSLLRSMLTKPDINFNLSLKVFSRNLRVFHKTWKANLMFNFLEPMLYL